MPYPVEDMTQMIKDFIEGNGLCAVLGAVVNACNDKANESRKKIGKDDTAAAVVWREHAHAVYLLERGIWFCNQKGGTQC